MPSPRSLDVVLRAARLYYEQGKSQGEIARIMGLSGPSVSRILAAAREQGIVQITIQDPRQVVQRVPELEARLMDSFGLAEAWVGTVPLGQGGQDAAAILAARLFVERLPLMQQVGISWGTTIARFIDAVDIPPFNHRLELVPMIGGMPSLDTVPDGNTSLARLAQKCGVSAARLESPAVVSSAETWAAIVGEPVIARALARAKGVDTAFIAIGSVDAPGTKEILAAMRLSRVEQQAVDQLNPAGDICGKFVDDAGMVLGPPLSTRVIGIELDDLRQVPRVVGVAGGIEKARGVAAALRSGVVDVPVLDAELAARVLERVGGTR